MNSTHSISSLFAQINAINKKYENILKITGEEFNIFRILKLHAAENRTHSAFLAELLDPKGSHGQEDVFLKLFATHLMSIGIKTDFVTNNAIVRKEQHIGFLNEDKSEGGRLDICMTDKNKRQIYIENKIYAGDQENQLVRYHRNNTEALLLYLCLDKKEVSDFSSKDLRRGEHFHVITYRDDIIAWLNECKKESTSHPMLRESIAQYINLIKYLTGQTINGEMNSEIINSIIKDKDSLNAAFTVSNSIDTAREKLLIRFYEMMNEIAEDKDLVFEHNINLYKNYTSFYFYRKEWKFANITFQFQARDKKLVYGIGRDAECKDPDDQLTKDVFKKLSSLAGTSNSWWPFCTDVEEPLDNWNRVEPWLAIQDGSIKDFVKGKVVKILELMDDYNI